MTIPCCADCRHFEPAGEQERDDRRTRKIFGECHRHPPRHGMFQPREKWPQVETSDWCGDHDPIES